MQDLSPEQRPRHLPSEGVRSEVWPIGNAAGLTRMGVWLRRFEPGFAGTHRHFHEVEEEWVYVLSGAGAVRIGPHRLPVRAGHFVGFPPGPRPHHFVAEGAEPLLLLEGGERRPGEDVCWYPDLRRVLRRGAFEAAGEIPSEEGDPRQCVHVDELPEVDFQHAVDARARRRMRELHRATGLARQAVRLARVSAGDRTTAYHRHDRTDEWVYVLDGRARVRVGDERFEVGPGHFLGHPAGGPAHAMEPIGELTYLMGGQIDAEDVAIYPEDGVQLRRGRLEPLASP
jgi:uncharacterized cupin superfamily protein